MAGIGQSSTPSSDQSTPWNSQFNMGRPTTNENHASLTNKYFPVSDKKRLNPEENGVIQPNIFQYNRQPTGFQSSNLMSNDKSYLSNVQSNLPNSISTGGNNAMNYNLYQRSVGGDSSMHHYGNLDMSSQSKQGYNSSARLGGMSQFIDSSSHTYQSAAPHRTISGGSMNPNLPVFNGQSMPKNRSGSYNFDSNSVSLNTQWDTHIGNFDSSEFPSLKPKPSTLMTQMSSGINYNYSIGNKSMSQINYQMVKSGIPIVPGEHTSEFSIQQEDFPALPVAQNPITCAELQRPSSAAGINAPNTVFNSCDNSSQSRNSSIVDANDFTVQKPYTNNGVIDNCVNDGPSPMMMSLLPMDQSASVSLSLPMPQSTTTSLPSFISLPSINNSSQSQNRATKKIVQGHNHYVANIPNDMVADGFGLIGLVKLLEINDTYDHLHLLAPGLETLSLNRELNNTRDVYHSFVSPLSSNSAGRPQDMDYPVPKEYRIRHMIIDRLADPLPEKLSDETLFWIFYNLTGEECQLVAARQLIIRQWRFNKRDRYWLTRDPGGADPGTHPNFERGSYIVWDPEKSKKIIKQLTVYYKDLENISGPMTSNKLPFCYTLGTAKRPLTSSMMAMNSSRVMSTNNASASKSMAAFFQQQQQQQQTSIPVVSDMCKVPAINTTISSTTTANINSSNDQVSRATNNNYYPQQQQQQQAHHHLTTMPSSSSGLLSSTLTITATITTTTVTATQQQ